LWGGRGENIRMGARKEINTGKQLPVAGPGQRIRRTIGLTDPPKTAKKKRKTE